MRALRGVFAGTMLGAVFGTAGLLLAAAPAQAASTASLSTNPTHGPANATITVLYQVQSQNQNCARVEVAFAWDGRQLGHTRLNNNCQAQVKIKPPNNDHAAGNHQIEAASGMVFGITTVGYTIDGGDATATPTSRMTTAAPDATSTDGMAMTGDGGGIVTASPAIIPTSVEAVAGSVPTNGGSSPFSTVAVIFGAVLVLGGGGILAMMVIRSRRAAAIEAINEPTMRYDDIWS
jgi:hypothetical protein